jgi:hypothetical protein
MSFLGLAMSPQGSSMVGDTGGETESASDSDTTAGKDDSSTDNSSSG